RRSSLRPRRRGAAAPDLSWGLDARRARISQRRAGSQGPCEAAVFRWTVIRFSARLSDGAVVADAPRRGRRSAAGGRVRRAARWTGCGPLAPPRAQNAPQRRANGPWRPAAGVGDRVLLVSA